MSAGVVEVIQRFEQRGHRQSKANPGCPAGDEPPAHRTAFSPSRSRRRRSIRAALLHHPGVENFTRLFAWPTGAAAADVWNSVRGSGKPVCRLPTSFRSRRSRGNGSFHPALRYGGCFPDEYHARAVPPKDFTRRRVRAVRRWR